MKTPTLRELAAIEALSGLLSSSVLVNIDATKLAAEAVACADALLHELGEKLPEPRQRFEPEKSSRKVNIGGPLEYLRAVHDTGKATLFEVEPGVGFWIPNAMYEEVERGVIHVEEDFCTVPVEVRKK